MPREREDASLAIDSEDRDIVRSLIAAVQKLTGGIEVEAARIVAARPFLADVSKTTVGSDGEDRDAVMEPIAGVHEPTIG